MKKYLQRDYIEESLRNCHGDPKETWKAMKQIWPTQNKTTKIQCQSGTSEAKKMADILKEHFSITSDKLSSSFIEPD